MTLPSATKVLLVDDHAVVREGLRAFLESERGVRVVGEAVSGEQALELVCELAPDVVLLDISMPDMDGIETARRLRRARPASRLIMVSINDDVGHVMDSLKAGAAGYIVKDEVPEEVFGAIGCVLAGGLFCSDAVFETLKAELGPSRELPAAERKIVERLAEGRLAAR